VCRRRAGVWQGMGGVRWSRGMGVYGTQTAVCRKVLSHLYIGYVVEVGAKNAVV